MTSTCQLAAGTENRIRTLSEALDVTAVIMGRANLQEIIEFTMPIATPNLRGASFDLSNTTGQLILVLPKRITTLLA
jgi:hypothetical protein